MELFGSPTSAARQLCEHLGLAHLAQSHEQFTDGEFQEMAARVQDQAQDPEQFCAMFTEQLNRAMDFKNRGAGRNIDGQYKCQTCDEWHDGPDKMNVLSKREFALSGMCQKCQDDTFGKDPDIPPVSRERSSFLMDFENSYCRPP